MRACDSDNRTVFIGHELDELVMGLTGTTDTAFGTQAGATGSAGTGRWMQPMLLLTVLPVITVPLTLVLTEEILSTGACHYAAPSLMPGGASCQVDAILGALTPGLLNLVPALWLFASNLKTRLSAILATIPRMVRLAAP